MERKLDHLLKLFIKSFMPGNANWKGPLAGAAFLMATSAIGPGFITQTTKFTEELLASFGFVILISVLMDIGAQLNIWRIVGISKLYAQDLANRVLPGSGYVLAVMIVMGGLAFNIGNIAGAGLGIQVLTGASVEVGAIASCLVAIMIFMVKEAGRAVDVFAKGLGFVMIGLTLFVAFQSNPPVGEAIKRTFIPVKFDEMIVLTIVGGTVGGYISFAGAHRLLDAGISGSEHLGRISKSAVSAILIASIMRVILFIAVLGVAMKGIAPGSANPAAAVFQTAAGQVGYKLFGLVFWCASITSVVGSAFTSITFARVLHGSVNSYFRLAIAGFIIFSTIVFLLVGQPVKLLVAAGAVNGLILPFALAVILLAAYRRQIVHAYDHPKWLAVAGWIVVLAMTYLGARSITTFF